MINADIKMGLIFAVLATLSVFLPVAEGRGQEFLLHNATKIEDTGTGLEWAIDVGTPSFGKCNGGKKTWQEASNYVNCLNSNEYLGYSDWRIPSVPELSRLISKLAKLNKIGEYGIAGPELKKLGFKNIRPSLYWSSAVTDEAALAVEVSTNGRFHPVGKLNTLYVWPVRGGKKEK